MIKTPFEIQDQVRFSTQPTLSTIPTLLSTTLSSVENGQTLQWFWSPLHLGLAQWVFWLEARLEQHIAVDINFS